MAHQHVSETNSVFRKNLENLLKEKDFWVEAEDQEWRSCTERKSKKLEAVRADPSTDTHLLRGERIPQEDQREGRFEPVAEGIKGLLDLHLS